MMTRRNKWLAVTLGLSVVAAAGAVALPRAGTSATAAPACRGMGMQHGGGMEGGHGEDMAGPIIRPVKNNRTKDKLDLALDPASV